MPRSRPVPQPRRSDLAPDEWEIYDAAIKKYHPDAEPGEDRHLGVYHGALLNSPAFSRLIELGGTTIRTRGEYPGTYSHADRALVDNVLAADLGTNCILIHHIPEGLAVGVRLAAVKALRYGREEELTEDERFLVEFVRAVASGTTSDELWDRMVDRIGVRGAVEYTCWIGYLLMTIRNIQTLTLFEPTDAEVDQMIAEFESGTRALPDPKAGIR